MDTNQNEKKRRLRKEKLQKRRDMSGQEVLLCSEQIIKQILEQPVYKTAEALCLYMPIQNEVDVSLMFSQALAEGKRVYLPKVMDGEMDFYRYDEKTKLTEGAYHILEPDSEELLVPSEHTLVVCPGAAFSVRGDRIGYGGGYYDRYLKKNPRVNTLAVCYEFQVEQHIPTEAFDRRVDVLITEKCVRENRP